MSLLIVDDTPDNIFLLKKILQKAGYEDILAAASAKEAFTILDGPEGSRVDVVFMDIMMPEISGIEACREIAGRDEWRDIPVIVLTAKSDTASLEEAFAAGAVDFLMKPINRHELLSRLRSTLRLKKETDVRKAHARELEERNRQLEKAMHEIKVLRGFIPICAYCKKIRDVSGIWDQMESYISKHSEAVFSHGICDGCMKTQTDIFLKNDPRKSA
jgi:CheY-like chemotaxis protein